jgi:pimeloyl-ACP methyl ester carboxylesterase
VKRIKVNGVELCAETFGDPADPPVLLVGVTMLSWPDELCAALAGRYVVRYDLRDAGQSTFVDPDAPPTTSATWSPMRPSCWWR